MFYNFQGAGYNLSNLLTGDLMCASYAFWIYITSLVPFAFRRPIKISYLALLSTFVAAVGACMILKSDYRDSAESSVGAGLVLVSAVFYAFYTNLLEDLADGDDVDEFPFAISLGVTGLLSIFISMTLYSGGLLTGYIEYEVPPKLALQEESLYALGSIICQYAWVRSAVCLGATRAGIGYTALVIPCLIGTHLINNKEIVPDQVYTVGILL